MGLALSGLASGFDWQSIVDQLIEVSRTPQNRMRAEKSQLASKTSALNEIKGLVTTFKSSLEGLGSENTVLKRSATFASTTTDWAATATQDTPIGQYVFELTQKATSAKLEGTTGVAGSGVPGGDPSTASLASLNVGRTLTAGTFTVNGEVITISSTANTLQSVLDDIQTALQVSDPTATVNYNAGTDQIELSSGSQIQLGAANDTSNFLQAMKLSTGGNAGVVASSSALGAISLTNPISSANFSSGIGDGSFDVNGVTISYTTGDSVQSVLNQINASSAGVNASYDYGAGKFVLTNKTTGDVGIFVTNDTGGLAGAMGFSGGVFTSGTDAEFTINGGSTLTSRSNVLDETAHGIAGLSITATTENDPQTVTISSDSEATKSSLNDFIAKYNAVQAAIEKYTKVDVSGDKVSAAILAGNRELADISRYMRRLLYEDNAALTGSVKRLSDMGVNFAGIENTISITDSAKLDSILADSADDVIDYFNNASGGLVTRMEEYLENLLSTSSSSPGTFKTQTDSNDRQSKSLDKQIEVFERQLESQRSLLETSFIAMEKAQSMYQQQGSYLANAFKQQK
jgi:flagellar hook-associated protein 2